ncbi:MAG: thiamine pyrophosphate-dependent enzyme, partial [Spirochaetota bacterium]|nr:thiamine pyrophosphate-dependent enzyme [Spirochaetota bacterium]
AMTLMGLGAFPRNHRLALGMLGMHGTQYANHAVTHCDLIISLGARFDDRVTGKVSEFAKQAEIAHIDIDRAEIEKIVSLDYAIAGDLKTALLAILSQVEYQPREDWLSQLEGWKTRYPLKYHLDGDRIKPQYFLEKLSEATKGKAIIATDVGQHQMWVAQYYQFLEHRTMLTSGGLGTMGFGFPAAMGAKLGMEDKVVITVSGDGSFQMNIQELGTCAMYGINLKIIILNNGFLGMVRQWQDLFYESRFSHTDFESNPDFVKLAEAYGLSGKKITKMDQVEEGIDFLLNSEKTAILEVIIPEEEKVYPMIPAGQPYDTIIDIDD